LQNDLPEPHIAYNCGRNRSDIPGRPFFATAHLRRKDGVALTG